MQVLFNLIDMAGVWDVVPKVTSSWSLAAFALAVVLLLVLKQRRGQIPPIAWLIIPLLVAIPIGASVYKNWLIAKPSIYRLRVTVIDPQSIPLEDAKVWSSFGGELKKVAGGWQVDIPEAGKPRDGKLTIFATKENAFLKGQMVVMLDSDHNPAITIQLQSDDSAKVRGQVVDGKNRAVIGARVCVVGFEAESVLTQEGGNFELPAHKAIGQKALLHAEKGGLAAKLWHPAGEDSAIIMLGK